MGGVSWSIEPMILEQGTFTRPPSPVVQVCAETQLHTNISIAVDKKMAK